MRDRGLKGATVALSEDGRLSCSYLGTDPSMTCHPSAYLRELDYASVETEMKQLQRVIKEHQSKSCKTLLLVCCMAVLIGHIMHVPICLSVCLSIPWAPNSKNRKIRNSQNWCKH